MTHRNLAIIILPLAALGAFVACQSGGGGSGGQSSSSAGTTTSSTASSAGGATSTAGSTSSSSSSTKSSSAATSGATTSSSTSTTSSTSSGGPPPGAKRVFVTSATYTGNLKLHGSGTDGLDGGDKLCQLAANAAVLGGTWKAWLSSSTANAIDRIADVGPWYRLDGAKVFNNKASIVTAGPMVPIDRNELGGTPMVDTWTGTKNSGVVDTFTCHDWTNDAPINGYEGNVGITVGVQFWTEGPSDSCSGKNTLYCFEQ